MEIDYHWPEEFHRVMDDAATPPYDISDVQEALDELERSTEPYELLTAVSGEPWLQEFTVTGSSGHRYGVVFEETATGLDALSYYRDPPLMEDPATRAPHGYSREHAMTRAKERRHG